MTAPTVEVSVAIPCFRNETSLLHTLKRISECCPQPAEILLHYDGGWEPSQDVTMGHAIPIRIFRNPGHVGPGGGRNLMFREAAHDVICSFDDDSWPLDTDFFERAAALMRALPRAAVVSASVYLEERPIQPPLLELNTERSFLGSACIHRQSIYLQLPGYIPMPAAYGVEEADLSLQIHSAGFEIYSTPWLRAWHDRPLSDKKHTVLPWIRNEILLAYLRFPPIAQPWGLVRALRHMWHNRRLFKASELLKNLGRSLAVCAAFRPYKRRYSFSEVWNHHRRRRRRFLIEPHGSGTDLRVEIKTAEPARRVLGVQYANPGAYPPLEHIAQITARRGWEVELLGIDGFGGVNIEFAPHLRVAVRRMRHCNPGWSQKLHYLRYALWCIWRAWRWKPDWIYASDPLAAPIARVLAFWPGRRLLYHEHDSPTLSQVPGNLFQHFLLQQRRWLGQHAHVVVLPNAPRLEYFQRETSPQGACFCVWNSPGVNEAIPSPRVDRSSAPLRLLYHGSIVPERFPLAFLEALAKAGPNIELRLVGYETTGFKGYTDLLKREAVRLKVEDRFEYLGPILGRNKLLACAAECDVGLSLLNFKSQDINMRHMAGASNKAFDYLSQGLALVVSPDPEWQAIFVASGCAIACSLDDEAELTKTLQWLRDHRQEVWQMGETGRQMILQSWNYEAQFAPVVEAMEIAAARQRQS